MRYMAHHALIRQARGFVLRRSIGVAVITGMMGCSWRQRSPSRCLFRPPRTR